MSKGNLTNNTKIRRKGSMLQYSLSKIKYLLVLALLLVLPMQAMAGGGFIPIIDQTDAGVNRLIAFWDTRGRDSFVQVTNTSTGTITIHVQIFELPGTAQTQCEECNFDDLLTPNDTRVYNIQNLMTNASPGMPSRDVCTGVATGASYGFMVISRSSGPGFALIGMFRIIDEAGYEYRANTAGEDPYA